jgi:hypothetical protein
MNIKNVTELDFDQIKLNLKAFLSAQDKFADYDFDGSSMNILLDILAYNTQYNALLAHMNINEAFLDTAQLRANVVSHAKSLGYTPRSSRTADAYLTVVVTGDGDSEDPAQLQIPRGTVFQGLVGNKQYSFVTNEAFTALKDANSKYTFNIIAKQGEIKTYSYRINGNIPNQKYIIPDLNIDTTTLIVQVRPSLTSDEYQLYDNYVNIITLEPETKAYFLQENYNGNYEIYFGDGNLSFKPGSGQIVDIAFVSTAGEEGNGASSFSINSTIGGYSNINIARTTGFARTSSGTAKETTASIKFNAPKVFSAQNRAVTAEDYKILLQNEFDFIQDINVWGGDVYDPPQYGKVLLSVKPFGADFISETNKQILTQFLQSKNVGSVTAEVLNPDYTYITMDVFFKYNPNQTSKTLQQLEDDVRQALIDYDAETLNQFDGVLRYSNMLRSIDNADQGIMNSFARLKMHKHVTPVTNVKTDYDMKFASPIYITATNDYTISSNKFTYESVTCDLIDIPDPNDFPNRIVQIRNVNSDAIVNAAAGVIYPLQGRVLLSEIIIQSSTVLLVFVTPNSNDIAPKYNQIIQIEFDETPGITVTGEEDLIATLGAQGAATYTTFPRHE